MVDLGVFTTQTADRVDDSGTFRSSVTEVQYVVLNLLDVDWQIAMRIRNADVCQLDESTRDRTESFGCAGSAYQTGRIGSITKSPFRSLCKSPTHSFREPRASAKALSAKPCALCRSYVTMSALWSFIACRIAGRAKSRR
jgi:hypothetical protein